MKPKTVDAFRDHNNVRDATVLEGVEDAAHQLHRAAARDIEQASTA